MKKFIIATTLLLLTMGTTFSQELEHLRPIPVTEISLVKHDTSSYKSPIAKQLCSYIDTSITFYECRNDKGNVGFLLNYHEIQPFCGYMSIWEHTSNSSEGITIHAGLKEAQRAEILLAKELDLKADSSQTIQRTLTAPRFYQYVRQYIFYVEEDGDTCASINFAIPEEYDCLNSRYLMVCDGGDDYWNAVLNSWTRFQKIREAHLPGGRGRALRHPHLVLSEHRLLQNVGGLHLRPKRRFRRH